MIYSRTSEYVYIDYASFKKNKIMEIDYKYYIELDREYTYYHFRDEVRKVGDYKYTSYEERKALGMNSNKFYSYDQNKLNAKRGFYFLMNGDDVVYIGASKNLYNRCKCHRTGRNIKEYDRVICYVTDYDPFLVEVDLIKCYKPKYNKQYNYE